MTATSTGYRTATHLSRFTPSVGRGEQRFPTHPTEESRDVAEWLRLDAVAAMLEVRAFAGRPTSPAFEPGAPSIDLAALYEGGPRAVGRDVIPSNVLLETNTAPRPRRR